MQTKKFKRHIEDFVCEHCGALIEGDGYTNHCPQCLWSKHVDKNPGDRAEKCGGMMEPVGLEGASPHYRIVHRCERCGTERRVNADTQDDVNTLVALAAKNADRGKRS